jgi:hypothetical protein
MDHHDRREPAECGRLAKTFQSRFRSRTRRQSCSAVSRPPDICGLGDLFRSSIETVGECRPRLEHRWLHLPQRHLTPGNECSLRRLRHKRPRRSPLLDVFVSRRQTRQNRSRGHQGGRSYAFPAIEHLRAQPTNIPKSKPNKLNEGGSRNPAMMRIVGRIRNVN